ncbi:MAG: tRNA (adenosine(37)-N6)-threonylcarbamoyltransferase complex ATPase subunit type 1 TsaE [Holosporaceae bacterium]|jgi:tRNA threonylcarbamoyl adenosine modification protein YjeE|nr:tRNA (adenosine(37)-N6)-threonylcarbamoyltransferase complex ATPase subunit type 1 TsaE [Holosporaceae bacterium]
MQEIKNSHGAFLSFSVEDTMLIASLFSRFAKKGQCFTLSGDLGYGKTLFAKQLIQSINPGILEVPSPTFTIVQTYVCDVADIWHVDCYRLKTSDEFYELGLEEALQNCITIIEWPEIIENFLPQDRIKISFSITEAENRIISYVVPPSAIL